MDISAKLGKIEFSRCFMNASGVLCTTEAELSSLHQSNSGATVFKSTTVLQREGNKNPRVYIDLENTLSINSTGLANMGLKETVEIAQKIRNLDTQKPIVISIAATSNMSDLPYLVERLQTSADIIEINLSCPNIANHQQVALDFEDMHYALSDIRDSNNSLPLWIKLPPYQDKHQVLRVAQIASAYKIDGLVCINSPSGLDIDVSSETTRMHANGGMGGIGGTDIIRQTRWNIRQFYLATNGAIPIIGAGGIKTGEDIFGHVLCGASAVQIGTAYLIEGPKIFDRLEQELKAVMAIHSCNSISNKIGALKLLPGDSL